tara:strand:+ start:405 stop:947 length:543 start_codon:yes stop_codon:yes gene_type:complete
MLSQKELTILISTWKPKCDQFNGFYNNVDNDEKHMVFSFKPNYEVFHAIAKSSTKMKWIDDNGYNIDPTWDKDTNAIVFRIKRVFNPDAREHFNKDLCNILNVKSLVEISDTFSDSQIRSMESIFSIYNKQFKVAFASKQKALCETNLGGKKISDKLDGQIKRMMGVTKMSYDDCLNVIG